MLAMAVFDTWQKKLVSVGKANGFSILFIEIDKVEVEIKANG